MSEQDYILMFIDMQDVEGNYLEFDTGIYDFTTPLFDTQDSENEGMEEEGLKGDDMLEVIEIDVENSEDSQEGDVELNVAGDEVSLEKDSNAEMDLESAAALVTQTPDTGAQTWILIALTLVINSFYYLSRRKAKVLAV
jgi:hypothetical protein